MLKFVKSHMETILGIEVFPLVSLIIFFAFFTVLLIWVFRSNKQEMSEIANIPLDENENLTNN